MPLCCVIGQAVDDLVPGGDLLHAFSWHLDLCVYIITMYAVYYVWSVAPYCIPFSSLEILGPHPTSALSFELASSAKA